MWADVSIKVENRFVYMHKDASILVTGATGFVGSYIVRYLSSLGFTQISACRRPSSDLSLIPDQNDSIRWVDFDLLDVDSIRAQVQLHEYVIHAAAMISFDHKDADALFRNNVEGTANLVNAALDYNVKKIVYISSIAVFGRSTNSPLIDEETEWVENRLTSNYARSKYLAEIEVWRGHYEGIPSIILNPSLIMGGGFWEKGSIEIVSFLDKGLRFYPVGGTGIVDVRDVARAAIIGLASQESGHRIILNGGNLKYRSLFSQIAHHLKVRVPGIGVNGLLRALASFGTTIASAFGRRSNISRETLATSAKTFEYQNQKSLDMLELQYQSSEQIISAMCDSYRQSKEEGKDYGILPLINQEPLFRKIFP